MLSTSFPISLLLIVLGGVPSSQSPTLLRLTAYLTGSFSSQEQSAADTTFADVRLRMVPIWKNRSDGPWLYVEQAMAGKEERPCVLGPRFQQGRNPGMGFHTGWLRLQARC